MRRGPKLRAVAGLALTLAVAGCTTVPSPSPSHSNPAATTEFRFGTAADPMGLDPSLVSDVDSTRVTRQIFEGLVTVDPNTSKPAPALATSWKQIDNGFGYTFTLRDKVTFQDGTPFNADAVCFNFERWFHLPTASGGAAIPQTFKDVFRTFSDDPQNSTYKSCRADDDHTVTISMNSAPSNFLSALTQPAFAIASPTALKNEHADVIDQTQGAHKVSSFALNPVGTGPFTLSSWKNGIVGLSQNAQYWGTRGQVKTVQLVTYAQPQARLQALMRGDIDGYDFVTADNLNTLVKGGMQVMQRDPFSVLYLGLNQAIPALSDLKVRQAIAQGLDKESIVKAFFIDGSAKTSQFVPSKLSGFNNQVAGLPFDRAKAKKLLAESSYKGEPLPFYYPLNVTRPYLPTPEKVYAEIAAELTDIGFTIKPVPVDWTEDYVGKITADKNHAFYLLGTNGTYADPDSFLGPLFGQPNAALGYNDPQTISKISRARTLTDGPDRVQAYQDINKELADSLPAVPIAVPISALALSPRVGNYPVNPMLQEVFNTITLS
ncbi:ABC transporter substrate-binding protein [Psychromicrobium xiongbiense]|uniref:ABC transporter substrate-binding protein n=1 Tax=Psychromicrobium xiongbiense TaxID=3051184 RepID=UPI002553DEFD|nr:ABC transporter substrate-binding protein [Psychromicrobium sp. YIM S02556]